MSTATAFALPARLTLPEASGELRRLSAHAAEAGGGFVVDAGALAQFDTSALAVLMEARRLGCGAIQAPPPKLGALARMYGVDGLLGLGAAA